MRSAHRLLPLLALFTLACGLVVPVPTPTPLPATVTQTASPTATFTMTPDLALTELSYTATPSQTPSPVPQPEDLLEVEKPLPPPALSPGATYELADERLIGSYGVRLWHDPQSQISFSDVILIESSGAVGIRIDQASAISPLTGTDINGDGFPEAVIETFSGGAHCCFSTQVYRLGAQPKLLLKKPESNAGGQFKDLDADGIQEFITYDDLFVYQYCSYAASPFVKSILVYDPVAELYLPASPKFPAEYVEDILRDTKIAENATAGEHGEWDKTTKCSVLPLVLDHIYSGNPDKAQSELRRVYRYADVESFWNEIMLAIQESPLYAPKEAE